MAEFCKSTIIGDVEYDDSSSIKPYLNKNRDIWMDPLTGEEHIESIDELWNTSVSNFIETIEDVNSYLYDDKPLNNRFIESNLSYDTGQNSDIQKKLIYFNV